MTIEEYLTDVKRIYYHMFAIIDGKQLLATGKARRLTDIRDSKGVLGTIRFSTLALPAAIEVSEIGSDHARIDYGDVHLIVWPIKEIGNDIQRDSTGDPRP